MPSWGQVSGVVTDEQGDPLPSATVLYTGDSTWVTTDLEGRFSLADVKGDFRLVVRYLSYHEEIYRGTAPDLGLRIRMHEESTVLGGVIITGEHDHLEDALHTDHLNASDLAIVDRTTLAAALSQTAGVDVLKTGVGIGKPVIRGLSNQRIVVSDRGIAQQGQQWGNDHGLELDAYGVERLEILKGPGSLLHGSDALGGVVKIMPPPVPEDGHIRAGIETQYKSNNGHYGGTAWLSGHQGQWTYRGRYSRQDFGDYRVPADTFVYLSFALPIFDGRLKNTAGQEESFEASIGRISKNSVSTIGFSRYSLDVGFFAGAIGFPQAFALQPDGDSRDIDFPSQSVVHDKIILNHRQDLREGLTWHLDAGWQQNTRREFSFPEFHSAGTVDPEDRLALMLELRTLTLNTHLDQELGQSWELAYGASLEHQQSESSGFEFLLPGYRMTRAGAFAVAGFQPSERARLTLGGRLDLGQNDADAGLRRVFDSEGNLMDSLEVAAIDGLFYNAAASVGYARELIPDKLNFRGHLGKSFRIPHPAETSTNGIHHGTFRHEQGNADLRSEHGYQLDADLEWFSGIWSVDLAAYFNFFEGFIYLAPSGRLSPLPEAGQIYQYRQQDAIYTGAELTLGVEPVEALEIELRAAYLYNYNLESGLALPFTPPANVRVPISYRPSREDAKVEWSLRAEPRYYFAQNRVDRNEEATPDAFLLDAGIQLRINPGESEKVGLEFNLQVFNILDTRYLDHLSRYRLIEVPEPGRNIVLGFKMPLDFHIN